MALRIGSRSFNSRTLCGVRPLLALHSVDRAKFQFTHPVRGATYIDKAIMIAQLVSIHAPRAGCDARQRLSMTTEHCFNSRTPCGVRQLGSPYTRRPRSVSIHAPRAGCDFLSAVRVTKPTRFQFTHPVRGATDPDLGAEPRNEFQFTHPVRGATSPLLIAFTEEVFQFTHPVRGATLVI